MSVGFKIKQLRESKNWSQPELADKLSLSPAALSNIENNKTRKIDFQLMAKICNIFEVEIGYFIDKKDIYTFKNNTDTDIKIRSNPKAPEGALENMLKRIETIENQIKQLSNNAF